MDLTPPSSVLAEIQFGVMARSFVIAAVVVAPVAWYWRARLRARLAPAEPDAATTDDAAEGVTLESVIDAIGRLGESQTEGDGLTVTIPHAVTLDGAAAPGAVVDAIVRDALSRSGLVPTAELDTGTERVIECRRRAGREHR